MLCLYTKYWTWVLTIEWALIYFGNHPVSQKATKISNMPPPSDITKSRNPVSQAPFDTQKVVI